MASDPTKPSTLAPSDIPLGVVVNCPLHQVMVAPATSCFACPHFAGVAVLNAKPAAVASIPWEQRHVTLCRYRRKLPMQRVGAPAPAAIGTAQIKAG
jgi:hypothetical protein